MSREISPEVIGAEDEKREISPVETTYPFGGESDAQTLKALRTQIATLQVARTTDGQIIGGGGEVSASTSVETIKKVDSLGEHANRTVLIRRGYMGQVNAEQVLQLAKIDGFSGIDTLVVESDLEELKRAA